MYMRSSDNYSILYYISHPEWYNEGQTLFLPSKKIPDGNVVSHVHTFDPDDIVRNHHPHHCTVDHERFSQHFQEKDPRDKHVPPHDAAFIRRRLFHR